MSKPRVIIADLDMNYVIPLQARFIEEYTYNISLEIITDQSYFSELFSTPQKADVLIVSEKLFDESLLKHGIEHIYILTEQFLGDETSELGVERIFKYTSVKEIFNQIVSTCFRNMGVFFDESRETKVIAVGAAKGGVGKTTVAMGIAGYLAQNYKKVFYVNAAELQNFHVYLENGAPITDIQAYVKLGSADTSIYQELKYSVRKEQFYYLPPFRAPIFSIGLRFSVYETIIKAVRDSLEYDYVIVDIDSGLNDEMMSLVALADKVIVVTTQNKASVMATRRLSESIGEINAEKYLFVCNRYDNRRRNAIVENSEEVNFSVGSYIGCVEDNDVMTAVDFQRLEGIDKIAYHIM